MGLRIYSRFMKPMTLSAKQLADFRSLPFADLGEGFPFPEDSLPKHACVEPKVPLMTLVSVLCDFLRSDGDSNLLRRLWGHFCASLNFLLSGVDLRLLLVCLHVFRYACICLRGLYCSLC